MYKPLPIGVESFKELIHTTWLPQALVIGVSYELFWTLNPKTLEPFIEAFKQRQIAKRDEINLSAWLNGAYVANAISACFGKNGQYPSEPITLNNTKEESEEKTVNAEVLKFGAFAVLFNEKFEKNSILNQKY